MSSHSRETLAVAVFLNLFTSERWHWRRRKRRRAEWLYEAAGCTETYGSDCLLSSRRSADNLSCYQMLWEEDSEWGLLIHLVIFPPIFHCIISVITHQPHEHNDEIFILAGKFLPDYI